MIIYLDILISLNIVINYFLLLLTVKYGSYKTKRKYIFIASLVGGLYSLISLLPKLAFITIIISKLICCFVMVVILFGIKGVLKKYYIFLTINVVFSGLMMILWFFIYPPGMSIKNGVVYFNISTPILIISILIAYFLINVFTFIAKKVPVELKDYIVDIYIGNKCVTLKGFVDTGNFLCDVFSSTPVVICNYNAIKQILPQSIKDVFINKNVNIDANFPKYHIRFIPCTTINNEKIVVSFKPDKFVLRENGKEVLINDVYVGLVSEDIASANKNYNIILNPMLVKC